MLLLASVFRNGVMMYQVLTFWLSTKEVGGTASPVVKFSCYIMYHCSLANYRCSLPTVWVGQLKMEVWWISS